MVILGNKHRNYSSSFNLVTVLKVHNYANFIIMLEKGKKKKHRTSTTSNFNYKNTEINCISGIKDNESNMYESTAFALSRSVNHKTVV